MWLRARLGLHARAPALWGRAGAGWDELGQIYQVVSCGVTIQVVSVGVVQVVSPGAGVVGVGAAGAVQVVSAAATPAVVIPVAAVSRPRTARLRSMRWRMAPPLFDVNGAVPGILAASAAIRPLWGGKKRFGSAGGRPTRTISYQPFNPQALVVACVRRAYGRQLT